MRFALSRRQSVAVAVVAALSAAPLGVSGAYAAPGAERPAAVVAESTVAASPISVPFLASGGQLLGAGKTGFLTRDPDGVSRWTRYADGVSRQIGAQGADIRGSSSDIVMELLEWTGSGHDWYSHDGATVYDMEDEGAAPSTIGRFIAYEVPAVANRSAFMTGIGGGDLSIIAEAAGVREVAGVPEPTKGTGNSYSFADSAPGAALVIRRESGASDRDVMVVDLEGARVSQVLTVPEGASVSGASISEDRVVWVERTGTGADAKSVFASVPRGSAEVTRVPLAEAFTAPHAGLMGDWILSYGAAGPRGGIGAVRPAGGEPVELLAYAESIQASADGTVLAVGTTADRGPGVYRIAVGADGRPAAELIAASGRPAPTPTTPLRYVSTSVPATIRLDGVTKTRLSWRFDTTEADLFISATRQGGGWDPLRTTGFRQIVRPRTTGTGVYADGSLGFDWAGDIWGDDRVRAAAPNGTYELKMTARPWNGMPAVTVTQVVEVKRAPRTHDFSDHGNGSPEILARRADGTVDSFDTRWDAATGRLVRAEWRKKALWWGDWNRYDRVEVAGDVAGDVPGAAYPDIVARDTSGVLWLHKDIHGGISTARVRISSGWGGYTLLAAGSELTGDGRADLLAVDKAGDLYLFKGTGSSTAPFAARKKIGHGWGIYQDVAAVGNLGGAATGDLVARDKDGVLWLYLGKGDGTFAPRTRIGGGWNAYVDLVGIDDANQDGRADLYARTKTGEAYFYAGTGDWKIPFKGRVATSIGAGKDPSGIVYNKTF
ncbi:FG-GAP repeat domain-containing protein [Streptomyces sp. NPDC004435]|uniref:FG-GAP repeat domain-containing protein n=1 Tax=Streptomyces sp. NPDC004435 TaxID=3364701 RepID=UPI003690A5BE